MPTVCTVRLTDIAMARRVQAENARAAAERARDVAVMAHRTWVLAAAACDKAFADARYADSLAEDAARAVVVETTNEPST